MAKVNWRQPLMGARDRAKVPAGAKVLQAAVEDGGLQAVIWQSASGWHLVLGHRQQLVNPVTGLPFEGRLPTLDEILAAIVAGLPKGTTMVLPLGATTPAVRDGCTVELWEARTRQEAPPDA